MVELWLFLYYGLIWSKKYVYIWPIKSILVDVSEMKNYVNELNIILSLKKTSLHISPS